LTNKYETDTKAEDDLNQKESDEDTENSDSFEE
jgi:hypothetical protein